MIIFLPSFNIMMVIEWYYCLVFQSISSILPIAVFKIEILVVDLVTRCGRPKF